MWTGGQNYFFYLFKTSARFTVIGKFLLFFRQSKNDEIQNNA